MAQQLTPDRIQGFRDMLDYMQREGQQLLDFSKEHGDLSAGYEGEALIFYAQKWRTDMDKALMGGVR